MQKALNLKKFNTFAGQLKGARVTEIQVAREEGPKGVRLKYSARDPKTRRTFNGEWVVGPEEKDSEFYDLAGKEFAVRRAESL